VTRTYEAVDGEGALNPELLTDYPGLAEKLAELPIEDYHFDAIGTIVVGTFLAPRYLDEEDLFTYDEAGVPVSTGDDSLEFIAVLPKVDVEHGIVPPFRTVVYQHAFTACKETMLAAADTFARFGIAMVGIDMVMHGARGPGGPGSCALDQSLFFDVSNFMRATDRVRQTVSDILAFVKALREGPALDVLPGPDGDGEPDLDLSRLAMSGQSMGASIQMNVLSLTPHLGAGVINVGGGVFTELMINGMLAEPGGPLDLAHLSLQHIATALGAQTAAEKADPIHYAAHLLHDPLEVGGDAVPIKQLLYQEAVDELVLPNVSTERTARILGLPLVEPVAEAIDGLETVASPVSGNLPGGGTAGLYQYVGAVHEFFTSAVDADLMRGGQLQAAIFVRTYLEDGVGVIVDPFDATQVATYDPGTLPWTLP
jgi:hypothetical protein